MFACLVEHPTFRPMRVKEIIKSMGYKIFIDFLFAPPPFLKFSATAERPVCYSFRTEGKFGIGAIMRYCKTVVLDEGGGNILHELDWNLI